MHVVFYFEKDGKITFRQYLTAHSVNIQPNFIEILNYAEEGFNYQRRFSNYKLEKRAYSKEYDGDNKWDDRFGIMTFLSINDVEIPLKAIFGDNQP